MALTAQNRWLARVMRLSALLQQVKQFFIKCFNESMHRQNTTANDWSFLFRTLNFTPALLFLSVDISGKKVTMKGCSSKLFCGINATQSLGLPVQGYGFGVSMKCCEGNLCNAAQSLRVYFGMLVPLLSLFVF